MATQQEGTETTGGTAEEPGIDEQATGEDTAEEEPEPPICAICNDPIDGTPLMAAYGPVHDPGCSSQTKRVP